MQHSQKRFVEFTSLVCMLRHVRTPIFRCGDTGSSHKRDRCKLTLLVSLHHCFAPRLPSPPGASGLVASNAVLSSRVPNTCQPSCLCVSAPPFAAPTRGSPCPFTSMGFCTVGSNSTARDGSGCLRRHGQRPDSRLGQGPSLTKTAASGRTHACVLSVFVGMFFKKRSKRPSRRMGGPTEH